MQNVTNQQFRGLYLSLNKARQLLLALCGLLQLDSGAAAAQDEADLEGQLAGSKRKKTD